MGPLSWARSPEMASLYATQTDRGLTISWTGTDLTGVLGTAIRVAFYSKTDKTGFIGGGACSNPVITNPGTAQVVSTFNYTPAAADIAVGNIGEWVVQCKATIGSGIAYSTKSTLEILDKVPVSTF